MSEHVGTVGYTAPAAEWEIGETNRAAYLFGHAAGWTHASYVATYPNNTDAQERLTDVAQRWATKHYEPRSRAWLRAIEGFADGAVAFVLTDAGD